jgi:HSF-type DNA-binding
VHLQSNLTSIGLVSGNEYSPSQKLHVHTPPVSSSMSGKSLKEEAFPVKLYMLLEEVEQAGEEHVIRWSSDGRKFTVYQPKVFAQTWMRRYFNQSKYKSFQRQLNLYNFSRESKGTIKSICEYHFFSNFCLLY